MVDALLRDERLSRGSTDAAQAVLAGLAAIEAEETRLVPVQTAFLEKHKLRDIAVDRWHDALLALKCGVRAAADDGAEGLYVRLFGRLPPPRIRKPKAKATPSTEPPAQAACADPRQRGRGVARAETNFTTLPAEVTLGSYADMYCRLCEKGVGTNRGQAGRVQPKCGEDADADRPGHGAPHSKQDRASCTRPRVLGEQRALLERPPRIVAVASRGLARDLHARLGRALGIEGRTAWFGV